MDEQKTRNYFNDKESQTKTENGGNIWIAGMKIIAWITFACIVVCGIVFAVQVSESNGGVAVIIFVGSVILAFLIVSMLLVFLNLDQKTAKSKK